MLEPHKLMLSRKVVGVWLLLCLLSIENYLRDQRNIRRQLQRPQEVRSEPDEANVLMAVIPNVLIAGAQKGGTTSIAHYLHSQQALAFRVPMLAVLKAKEERRTFSTFPRCTKMDCHTPKALSHCQNATLVIDGTPGDQLKIIFTLREPQCPGKSVGISTV